MKNLSFSVLAVVFYLSVTIPCASLEKSSFVGKLQKDAAQKEIVLKTVDNRILNLSFRHDEEEMMVIDDFGAVEIRGDYSAFLNVLLVEEIIEIENIAIL